MNNLNSIWSNAVKLFISIKLNNGWISPQVNTFSMLINYFKMSHKDLTNAWAHIPIHKILIKKWIQKYWYWNNLIRKLLRTTYKRIWSINKGLNTCYRIISWKTLVKLIGYLFDIKKIWLIWDNFLRNFWSKMAWIWWI